jgi:hypothetical protein
MKPTLRKNGSKMITVKVSFNLNKADVIHAILKNLEWSHSDTLGQSLLIVKCKKLSVKKLMEIVKDEMFSEGSRETCLDELPNETIEECTQILNARLKMFD